MRRIWRRRVAVGSRVHLRWAADGGNGFVVDTQFMTTDPRLIADSFDALIGALLRIEELMQESRDEVVAAVALAAKERDAALAVAALEDLQA